VTCAPCPAGRFGNTSALATSLCSGPCGAGTFSGGGAVACLACTASPGYACSLGATTAGGTLCPVGTFSDGDTGPCIDCTPGFFCPSPTVGRLLCPFGFYCPARSVVGNALACPPGYFCAAGTASATAMLCTSGALSAAWLDVNGDAVVDLVSSTLVGPVLFVRDSVGGGECSAGEYRGLALASTGVLRFVTHADVDGDGLDDVLGVTGAGLPLLLLANGTAALTNGTSARSFVAPPRCTSISPLDIDGDGDVDALLTASTGSTTLLLNNGSGFFTDVSAARLRPSRAGDAVSALAFDADGDGDVDVLVAMSDVPNRLFMNDGAGAFVDEAALRGVGDNLGGSIRSAVAGDADSDGDLDVAVVGGNGVRLFRNNGTGGFAAETIDGGLAVSGAAFGDLDLDGDVDLLLNMSASAVGVVLANNGSASFATASAASPLVSAAPVLVDIDGDGDLDAPTMSLTNAVVPPGFIGIGVLWVRVLGRSGARSSHGAVVVLRHATSGTVAASGRVGGSTSGYDVHFRVPVVAARYDVEVTFSSGRRITKTALSSLGGVSASTESSAAIPVIAARDVPAIEWLRLSPPSALLGVGASVTVLVQALGNEVGLRPDAAACTVNGVNVAVTMSDLGNGTYTFVYTAAAGHASVAAAPVSMALADTRWGVVSTRLVTSAAVAVDVVAPRVSFDTSGAFGCSPANASVSANANQTLCLSCGSVVEEPNGCVIWLIANASSSAALPLNFTADASNRMNTTTGPFRHGDVVLVRAWAVDKAGNVGPAVMWTWEVDLQSPVTLWTPQSPPPHSNSTSLQFSFGCTETVRRAVCGRDACSARK
jgi:hypothetical protein